MTNQLKTQIAQALNRDPEEILMVKPYTTHINVIFTDYRKTAVPHQDLEHHLAQDKTNTEEEVTPSPLHPLTPSPLNETYQTILATPHMFDREQLRQLAAELHIPGAATMNKKPLVTAINKWKKENQS